MTGVPSVPPAAGEGAGAAGEGAPAVEVAPATAAPSREPGQLILGKYCIEGRLSGEGLGQVFLASQLPFRRRVVLKIVPLPGLDDARRQRLLREVAQASRLAHRNALLVYEIGETSEGELYLAMEHLDGESLLSDVARSGGSLPAPRACRIAIDVGRAVRAAHAMGLVHGDLEASDVMLLPDGEGGAGGDLVKVLDFGLARSLRLAGVPLRERRGAHPAPPELGRGQDPDGRTDVYMIGTLLELMLGGAPRHVPTTIPLELEVIVRRCTEPSPAARYPSVEELTEDLKAAYRLIAGEHLVSDGLFERVGLGLGAATVQGDSTDLGPLPGGRRAPSLPGASRLPAIAFRDRGAAGGAGLDGPDFGAGARSSAVGRGTDVALGVAPSAPSEVGAAGNGGVQAGGMLEAPDLPPSSLAGGGLPSGHALARGSQPDAASGRGVAPDPAVGSGQAAKLSGGTADVAPPAEEPGSAGHPARAEPLPRKPASDASVPSSGPGSVGRNPHPNGSPSGAAAAVHPGGSSPQPGSGPGLEAVARPGGASPAPDLSSGPGPSSGPSDPGATGAGATGAGATGAGSRAEATPGTQDEARPRGSPSAGRLLVAGAAGAAMTAAAVLLAGLVLGVEFGPPQSGSPAPRVRVSLASTPAGATVTAEGVVLGVTPFSTDLDRRPNGQPQRFFFHLAGHQDLALDSDLDRDAVLIEVALSPSGARSEGVRGNEGATPDAELQAASGSGDTAESRSSSVARASVGSPGLGSSHPGVPPDPKRAPASSPLPGVPGRTPGPGPTPALKAAASPGLEGSPGAPAGKASPGASGSPASPGANGSPASPGANGSPASPGANGSPASPASPAGKASPGANGSPASPAGKASPGPNGSPASPAGKASPGPNGSPASPGPNGSPAGKASPGPNGSPAGKPPPTPGPGAGPAAGPNASPATGE